MSLFLYFIPTEKDQPLSDELLSGLSDVIDSTESVASTMLTGRQSPLGQGYLIADRDALGPDRVLQFGDKSSWEQRGQAYVRLYDDNPVDPTTLERDKLLPGIVVLMGDGQPWRIPVARIVDQSMESKSILPARMKLDGDGWVAGPVIDQYARLAEIASAWWDQWYPPAYEALMSGQTSWESHVKESPINSAIEVLSYNYRIGRAEASLLGLFTNYDNASDVMGALVDAGTACRFLMTSATKKKTEPIADSLLSVGDAA